MPPTPVRTPNTPVDPVAEAAAAQARAAKQAEIYSGAKLKWTRQKHNCPQAPLKGLIVAIVH